VVLDGRENRRRTPDEKPNENYARELMELHTLGVHGGYTQQDVMEVARCLTGWTCRDKKKFFKGRVEFHAKDHDDGPKRVLGVDIPSGLGRAISIGCWKSSRRTRTPRSTSPGSCAAGSSVMIPRKLRSTRRLKPFSRRKAIFR
jgi:hypothetical protein